MENRCLLHRIDPKKGTITLPNGKEYPLTDTAFPTIDWKKPYELTTGGKGCNGTIGFRFPKLSEKLTEIMSGFFWTREAFIKLIVGIFCSMEVFRLMRMEV